jgi:hypothetical protein
MPTPVEKIIEELHFLSDRISTQVRTIAVSLIALVWVLLIGTKDAPFTPAPADRVRLLGVAGLSLSAMVLDYLQYLFGYLSADTTRARAEKSPAKSADYDYDDWRLSLRRGLFWVKQLVLLAALIIFALVLAGQFRANP